MISPSVCSTMCDISLAKNVVLPVSGLAKTNPKSPLRNEPRLLLRNSNLHLSPGVATCD